MSALGFGLSLALLSAGCAGVLLLFGMAVSWAANTAGRSTGALPPRMCQLVISPAEPPIEGQRLDVDSMLYEELVRCLFTVSSVARVQGNGDYVDAIFRRFFGDKERIRSVLLTMDRDVPKAPCDCPSCEGVGFLDAAYRVMGRLAYRLSRGQA